MQPQQKAPVPDVDVSRWVIVYPVYLNARKTVQEGRKLAKVHCVDNPTCVEIQQVCTKLGLESHIEADKCYSRNATMRGRVRVNLKDVKTGVPKNADVASRTALLKKLGTDIAKVRGSTAAPATTTTTTTTATSSMPDGPRRKKKGKK